MKKTKKLLVLGLAAAMTIAGVVAVHADYDTYYSSVAGCVVKYEAECTEYGGYAQTWLCDGSASASTLYAKVTLYVLNNKTGVVSEYGTDEWTDSEDAIAEVEFNNTGNYETHYVDTYHSAYIEANNSQKSDTYEFNTVVK